MGKDSWVRMHFDMGGRQVRDGARSEHQRIRADGLNLADLIPKVPWEEMNAMMT
jgi:hypothetical protein